MIDTDKLYDAAMVDVDALVDAGYQATLGRHFSADTAQVESWKFRVDVRAAYSGKPEAVRVYVMGFRDALVPKAVELSPVLASMELD